MEEVNKNNRVYDSFCSPGTRRGGFFRGRRIVMACVPMTFYVNREVKNEIQSFPIGMRRSSSEPVLRSSVDIISKSTVVSVGKKKIRGSRSFSIFPLTMEDSEIASDEEDVILPFEPRKRERVNWMERLLELRQQWKDRQQKHHLEEEEHDCCDVSYDDLDEDEEDASVVFDVNSFSKFLTTVPWTTTKLFSQLAFLCNMAYEIPDLKGDVLKSYYDLDLVTSSLEKKREASKSISSEGIDKKSPPSRRTTLKRRTRPSVAYQVAASAASYIHSRAKGILSIGGDVHGVDASTKGEVTACMAASTMAAVVAVEENVKQEAARDLQSSSSSSSSSPCEWFVCDDHKNRTRCFVVQGSDSLESWQANLSFEPTRFEGTKYLVHRGIYEAAKGIYDQVMPEITDQLERYGDDAKLRFTGHSLGGSLSLLVNLMLISRGVVDKSNFLPVVTFGSPSVFCGGRWVLEELGLEEEKVWSVMMHRDIVPRAFSCNYPNHVSQLLKRLNRSFLHHPCLNSEKFLYSPVGQLFVLQPDENFSPPHPFLPAGSGLYALDNNKDKSFACGLRAFLNSPHPLETLSNPNAYGSEGTILRDHDSRNYLKAVNAVLRQKTKSMVRRSRMQRLQHWWPLLTEPEQTWSRHHHFHRRWHLDDKASGTLLVEEVANGV